MVAVAAAATALGLYAADTGTSFENSSGKITEASDAENSGFWAVGTTAPDKADVAEYGEAPRVSAASDRPSQWSTQNKYLDVKTTFGNPLTRKAKADGSAYDWSAKNTTYFDSLVQFTHCDYDMTIADYSGAKIVVYTQLNEAEDETNLVIKAASDAVGTAKSYVIEGFEPYEDKDGWARLTLKAHKNITTSSDEPVMAFEVFVNGESVTSTAARTDVSAIANLTDTGKELAKEGKLFLSLSQANSDIVSASFDGQGKIDDLTFTTTVPNFSAAKDPEFFKIYAGENVASFTVDGVAGVSGAAIRLDDTPQTFEVVATYANGYQAGKWTTTGSATVEDGTSFVVTADGATGTIVAKAAFATLTYTDSEGNPQTVSAENVGAAISAIPSGATNVKITLAQNDTTAASVLIKSDITIDLNGKTFTYTLGSGYMFLLGKGKTLTVMDSNLNDNGKLAAPNSGDGLIDFSDGDLSISNGTFDGFIMGENAVITGGKFTHDPTEIAVAVPGYEWVKGQDNYYTLKPATATMTLAADKGVTDVTVAGATLSGTTITYAPGTATFTVSAKADTGYAMGEWYVDGKEVTPVESAGTYSAEITPVAGKTIAINAFIPKAVVTIGGKDYPVATLADAFSLVKASGKITLAGNDTIADGSEITTESDSNVTIDLAGRTLTYNGEGKLFTNMGTLTITNSTGTGVINALTDGAAVINNEYGTTKIAAGQFNGALFIQDYEGSFSIKGGSFDGAHNTDPGENTRFGWQAGVDKANYDIKGGSATYWTVQEKPTTVALTVTWSDANITSVQFGDGELFTAGTATTNLNKSAEITVKVVCTGWNKGVLTAGAGCTVNGLTITVGTDATASATLALEVLDPTQPLTPADAGITSGAFANAGSADVQAVVGWAATYGFSKEQVNAITFDSNGDPSGSAEEIAVAEAYLLNCSAANLETAKAAFKFPSITPGTVPGISDENYNGTVEVKGANAVDGPWTEAGTTENTFYKAFLRYIPANAE